MIKVKSSLNTYILQESKPSSKQCDIQTWSTKWYIMGQSEHNLFKADKTLFWL